MSYRLSLALALTLTCVFGCGDEGGQSDSEATTDAAAFNQNPGAPPVEGPQGAAFPTNTEGATSASGDDSGEGAEEAAEEVDNCDSYPGVGCPCVEGSDCAEGYCIPTADGKSCTEPCESGSCPADFVCQGLDPSLCPECPPLCVPVGVYLCTPCEESADCLNPYSSGGLAGETSCVEYGDAGYFCAIGCAGPEGCPTGYICSDTNSIEGDQALRCIAQDNTCECSQIAIDAGATTLCTPSTGGPGCVGERKCSADGLGGCTPLPTDEVCDGVDNDCDGTVDNGACALGEACGFSNGAYACACVDESQCDIQPGDDNDGKDCLVNGQPVTQGTSIECTSDCGPGTQVCNDGVLSPCEPVDNGILCTDYASCESYTLCDDACPAPPAETCNGLDDNCNGQKDEDFNCVAASVETESCPGSCGSRQRVCDSGCSWGPWTDCEGGTCVPGETEEETQACGNCGVQTRNRTCTENCGWGDWSSWSSCSGEGTCSPGATEACEESACKQRTCDNSCNWGTCGLKPGAACAWNEGTNFQCCGSNKWQFCSQDCQWFDCQACEGCGCQ